MPWKRGSFWRAGDFCVEEARKPKAEIKTIIAEETIINKEVDNEVDVVEEKFEKKFSRKKSTRLENKEESEQIE